MPSVIEKSKLNLLLHDCHKEQAVYTVYMLTNGYGRTQSYVMSLSLAASVSIFSEPATGGGRLTRAR